MSRSRLAVFAASALLAVSLGACGSSSDSTSTSTPAAAPPPAAPAAGESTTTEAAPAADLAGTIKVDGSSTVGPLTSAVAETFNGENPNVNVNVGTSGTGGGFEVFCKGETDISDASRAIKSDEEAACKKAGIDFTEVRVASDGITMVTSAATDVGTECLTFEQLKKIWGPTSKVSNWSQADPKLGDVPLKLAGPGSQSGTYDFFNETVLGEDAKGDVIEPRQDYAASENDNDIVQAVEGADGTLGFFGFTYFEENAEGLKAYQLDKGDGKCVAPDAGTITDGTYPLSRPLFIYVANKAYARPEVKGFVDFYLENATQQAQDAQYVPAPQEALDASKSALGMLG